MDKKQKNLKNILQLRIKKKPIKIRCLESLALFVFVLVITTGVSLSTKAEEISSEEQVLKVTSLSDENLQETNAGNPLSTVSDNESDIEDNEEENVIEEPSADTIPPYLFFDSSKFTIDKNNRTVTFTGLIIGDEAEDMSKVSVFLDNGDFSKVFSQVDGHTFSFTVSQDCSYVIHARDEKGNESSVTVTVSIKDYIKEEAKDEPPVAKPEYVIDGSSNISFSVTEGNSCICVIASVSNISVEKDGYFFTTNGTLTVQDLKKTSFISNCSYNVYENGILYCYVKTKDGKFYKASYTVNNVPALLEETYEVTFVDYNNAVLKVLTVKKGEEAFAPDVPARKGYTFIGWDTSFEYITRNLTVKAVYEKKSGSTNSTCITSYKNTSTTAEEEKDEFVSPDILNEPILLDEFSKEACILPISMEENQHEDETLSNVIGKKLAESLWEEETNAEMENTESGASPQANLSAGKILGIIFLLGCAGFGVFYLLNKKFYWVYLPF